MTKPSKHKRGLSWRLLPGVAVWLGACAPAPTQVKVDDLNRQIAALRAQNTQYARQIEELENQVFVLGDRAQSDRVASQRAAPPRLPRVTLSPGQEVPGPAEGESSAVYSFGDDDTVEYVGEAAKPSKSRPLLRLVGDGGGVSLEEPEAPARRVAVAPSSSPSLPRKTPAVSTEARKLPLRVSDGNAMLVYKSALDHLKGARHADAAAGFRDFLAKFPQHEYADNAQYWLAECYYDLKDFVTAVSEFRKVVEGYPQGNKVPDALLKVGFAYLLLGNEPAGRSTLTELVRSYPSHSAAALAGEKLGELNEGADDAAWANSRGR